MTQTLDDAGRQMAALSWWDGEGMAVPAAPNRRPRSTANASIDGPDMVRPAMQMAVDAGPHDRDGLLPRGREEAQSVPAFIAGQVLAEWAAEERRGLGDRPRVLVDPPRRARRR